MKKSAGILIYKFDKNQLQVLIVHPAGHGKEAVWSIPKGQIEEEKGETPEIAARRETFEEVGINITKDIKYLGEITYQSKRKKVFCYTSEYDGQLIKMDFEVDRAEFYQADKAKELLHRDQGVFVDRLRDLLYDME